VLVAEGAVVTEDFDDGPVHAGNGLRQGHIVNALSNGRVQRRRRKGKRRKKRHGRDDAKSLFLPVNVVISFPSPLCLFSEIKQFQNRHFRSGRIFFTG
jgi:hypothetical protein